MKKIWKYTFPVADEFTITMPAKARILLIHVQGEGRPCIWAEIDTKNLPEKRMFRLYGTGHTIEDEYANRLYIGTIFMYGGGKVYHLFEVTKGVNKK